MVCNIINNFDDQYHYNTEVIENIILKISESEKKMVESINFIFSDDNHLNDLKIKYFNKDQYTDVIAFNLEQENHLIDGEIYISMDRVIENAARFSCSINDELKRIMIHGLLHLMGYQDKHKHDKEKMTELENQYIKIDSRSVIN
tara:strand:- start:6550 stop:6984 length:435 start_codon:yes stop_codon:yes gene_type:complete